MNLNSHQTRLLERLKNVGCASTTQLMVNPGPAHRPTLLGHLKEMAEYGLVRSPKHGWWAHGESATSANKPITGSAKVVLNYLEKQGYAATQQICRDTNYCDHTVYLAVGELAKQGLVYRVAHGYWAHDNWDPPNVGWRPPRT